MNLHAKIRDLIQAGRKSKKNREKILSENNHTHIFEISKGKQNLFYFGMKHTNNPQNKKLHELKNYWLKFEEKNKPEKSIVFVEGRVPLVRKSENEAITKDHEGGLITFLASQKKYKVSSPEPERKREIKYLLKYFSKDNIVYYYFARYMRGYHKNIEINKPDVWEYAKSFSQYYSKLTGWADYDFSIQNMEKLHNKNHDHEFEINDVGCFSYDSSPNTSNLAAESSLFRDISIVSEIYSHWNEGKNMFVVYGSGHAISQETVLRELLI